MYKLLLIQKYLLKRRIAWVSVIAVTLCTAMVLVVISVMGGWLEMFRNTARGLSSDIIVDAQSLTGFPYYEKMIDELKTKPEIEFATPMISSFGIISIMNQKSLGVQVYGLRANEIGRVNNFPQTLYWQYHRFADKAETAATTAEKQSALAEADAAAAKASFAKPLKPEDYRNSLPTSQKRTIDPSNWPGMIVGAPVIDIRKEADGKIAGRGDYNLRYWIRLTVMGIDTAGMKVDAQNKQERNYWVVDDSRTQVYFYDSTSVYVDFDLLQKDLAMEATQDPPSPARTSQLQIKLKPGVSLAKGKAVVREVVDKVLADGNAILRFPPIVQTWEESQKQFLGAVEKEKVLVTVLFSFISVVAVFLIFCIFYMIVAEKTRDIGILKAVGATQAGVATIFLGYGLAIGIVGGGLGFLVGWQVCHNINWIHEQMGKLLGIRVFTPESYAFDTIPNTINPREAAIIVAVAILSSVLGAVVPAWSASRLDVVKTLRFE